MESVIFRFSIVWVLLHIILFFIERYRYNHTIMSWYSFKEIEKEIKELKML